MPGYLGESTSVKWCSPQWIVDAAREVMGSIELDPCGNPDSLVNATTTFQLPETDGLLQDWNQYTTIYQNSPFGRYYMHKITKEILSVKQFRPLPDNIKAEYDSYSIKDWIKKDRDTFYSFHWQDNPGPKQIMALMPASVGTKMWQKEGIWLDVDRLWANVCFLEGRVKFLGATQGAPMDCAVVYWDNTGNGKKFTNVFKDLGYVVRKVRY